MLRVVAAVIVDMIDLDYIKLGGASLVMGGWNKPIFFVDGICVSLLAGDCSYRFLAANGVIE